LSGATAGLPIKRDRILPLVLRMVVVVSRQ